MTGSINAGKSLVGTIGRERLMKPQFMGALFIGVLGLQERRKPMAASALIRVSGVMKIGPDTMTFTAISHKVREQFVTIFRFRTTIIVLDAQQDELRDMTLDIRVLRNVGQKDDNENLEATRAVYIAPDIDPCWLRDSRCHPSVQHCEERGCPASCRAIRPAVRREQ